jgi:hypothetical protein
MSMKGLIKSSNGKQLVPVLFAITILYQVVYNVLLFDSLPEDAGFDECPAGGNMLGGSSTYCQEVEVFRSWKDEDVEGLLKRTEPEPIEQDHWDLIEFGRQVNSVNLTVSSANNTVDTPQDATAQPTSTSFESEAMERAVLNEAQMAASIEDHLTQLTPTVHESAMSNIGSKQTETTASETSTVSVFLEKKAKQLVWTSVAAWSKYSSNFLASKAPSIVSREQVRHLHWSGSLPKVACVTPISGSRHAKARMMYFIDNFRLQDYEGLRQLVLVYHYLDESAGRLAHSYANGSFIKAVAAHGNSTFPSNSALRYGAWSSDADVIAHWDFDEWHDPSQLSMQIRAMALVSRPACVLKHDEESKRSKEETAPGFSLVGERAWMKRYWHPYLQTEDHVVTSSQQDHIVELDMKTKGFAVSDNDAKPSQELESSSSSTAEQRDWNVGECIDLDNSSTIDSVSHTIEATIGANMGEDMGKAFHKLMARRHDITLKLQLLCLENTSERDSLKHEFNRKHVIQMLSIRAELDKHIAATAALFHPSIES